MMDQNWLNQLLTMGQGHGDSMGQDSPSGGGIVAPQRQAPTLGGAFGQASDPSSQSTGEFRTPLHSAMQADGSLQVGGQGGAGGNLDSWWKKLMAGQGAFNQGGSGSQMPSTLPGAPGSGSGGHPQIANLLQSLLGGAAQGLGQGGQMNQGQAQGQQGGMNAGGGQGLLWHLLNRNQNQ